MTINQEMVIHLDYLHRCKLKLKSYCHGFICDFKISDRAINWWKGVLEAPTICLLLELQGRKIFVLWDDKMHYSRMSSGSIASTLLSFQISSDSAMKSLLRHSVIASLCTSAGKNSSTWKWIWCLGVNCWQFLTRAWIAALSERDCCITLTWSIIAFLGCFLKTLPPTPTMEH